jgi:hypothetical protein
MVGSPCILTGPSVLQTTLVTLDFLIMCSLQGFCPVVAGVKLISVGIRRELGH